MADTLSMTPDSSLDEHAMSSDHLDTVDARLIIESDLGMIKQLTSASVIRHFRAVMVLASRSHWSPCLLQIYIVHPSSSLLFV